eukprot:sb/3478189/
MKLRRYVLIIMGLHTTPSHLIRGCEPIPTKTQHREIFMFLQGTPILTAHTPCPRKQSYILGEWVVTVTTHLSPSRLITTKVVTDSPGISTSSFLGKNLVPHN